MRETIWRCHTPPPPPPTFIALVHPKQHCKNNKNSNKEDAITSFFTSILVFSSKMVYSRRSQMQYFYCKYFTLKIQMFCLQTVNHLLLPSNYFGCFRLMSNTVSLRCLCERNNDHTPFEQCLCRGSCFVF